jgi:hypothetical protein
MSWGEPVNGGGTASARLRAKLELAAPAMRASGARLWGSEAVRDLYPIYLATMHGIVRSAVTLIDTAARRARALARSDDVAAGLVPYLEHHGPEEAGHDGWLLEDLAELGFDPEAVVRKIPSPRVASLVGAQYYWILHHHPVTILGHMAVVEGYAPARGFAQGLSELTGYPLTAFRSLRRHEHLDIRHRRELYQAIDSLPLQPDHETLIGLSGLHTISGIIDVISQVAASAPAGIGVR